MVWQVLGILHKSTAKQAINFQKRINLLDGFWRMIVAEDMQWNFCYVLPTPPGESIKLVVPSALQIYWAKSPSFFAAVTKTIQDNTQQDLKGKLSQPPHPMEPFTEPKDPPGPGQGCYGNFLC